MSINAESYVICFMMNMIIQLAFSQTTTIQSPTVTPLPTQYTRINQMSTSHPAAIPKGIVPLNCSAYGVNSTNTTIQQMSWPARLQACFNANAYDTTQPPLPATYSESSIYMFYDYSVVYVISFYGNSISLMGQLVMQWTDYYRIWDSSDIPLTTIQIPLSEIWYPQILFQSAVKKRSYKLCDKEDTALLFSGSAIISIQNIVEGHCEVIDYYNFPFDTQVCTVHFALDRLFFSTYDIILCRSSYTYEFQNFPNEEWEMLSVSSLPVNTTFRAYNIDTNGISTNSLNFSQENVQTGFTVNITLRRFPHFFLINIVAPVFVLTVVEQISFAIPEHSDANLLVPLTVLLGFLFIQSIVAAELPHSAQTPSLDLYIASSVVLSGATCILCAARIWLLQCECKVRRPLATAINWAQVVLFPSFWPALCNTRRYRVNKNRRQTAEIGPNISEPGLTANQQSQQNQQQVVPSNHSQLGITGNNNAASHSAEFEKRPSKANPWRQCAEVLNRLFAVLHFAAILALFFSLFLPGAIKYSSHDEVNN